MDATPGITPRPLTVPAQASTAPATYSTNQNHHSSIGSAAPKAPFSCFSHFAKVLGAIWDFITQIFCCSCNSNYTLVDFAGVYTQKFISPEERNDLEKILTPKNIDLLEAGATALTIGGEPYEVTYQHDSMTAFHIEDFLPGFIFRFSFANPDQITDKVRYMENGEATLKEEQLDGLRIPEFITIKASNGKKELLLIAERNYSVPLSSEDIQLDYEKYEKELLTNVSQLTTFICETKFGNIDWHTIPIIKLINGELKIVLDHLAPSKEGVKEGLLKLIRMFPSHAVAIQNAAQRSLYKAEFSPLREDLHQAVAKAKKITQRNVEISQFHSKNGVKKESPAIPPQALQMLEQKLANSSERELFAKICSEINNEMAEQVVKHTHFVSQRNSDDRHITGNVYPHLIHGRELKLTLETNTPRTLLLIQKIIPFLQENGFVHSVLTNDEAFDYNIDLRHNLENDNTWIIQF